MSGGNMRFAGKVALVTGGRMGIGLAIARRLRDEGARVITAQRGRDAEFEAVEADFADPDCPAVVVAEVIARAGRLDVLVNNAGIMQEARAEEMTLSDWNRMIGALAAMGAYCLEMPEPAENRARVSWCCIAYG